MTGFYCQHFKKDLQTNILLLATLFLLACQPLRNMQVRQTFKKSPVFSKHFTGFCLFDPVENKFLINQNESLYFTPASNTKILTALNSLETFGDSLPTFAYSRLNDTLIIQALGDPTFLHPSFESQPALAYLRKNSGLKIIENETPLAAFGPGWAWDDFQYNFQAERSWFPLYGNMVHIRRMLDSLFVIPEFFRDYVQVQYGETQDHTNYRDVRYNLFNVWVPEIAGEYETEIPFDHDNELLLELLEDTLHQEVSMITGFDGYLTDTLFSQSTLEVLAKMVQTSDNFLAEQLLIQAALVSGYSDIDEYRSDILRRWSDFNPTAVQWYDGSGLSRYNLITPLSLVNILKRLYEKTSWQTIQTIFPAGGQSGTLTEWYGSDPPFIYAKTGTLSNNHNLSGFLITDSGKTLIFSLMNNNYVTSSYTVKQEMAKLLYFIKRTY